MKHDFLTIAISAACMLVLASPVSGKGAASPAAQPSATSASASDMEQVARRLVTQSANIKEGDVVMISGRTHDAELMEDIAVEVARVGGHPLITYESDRLAKRMFFDVPAKYDSQTDAWGTHLVDIVDVFINLGNGMTENLFEGADPARLAARGKANVGIGQAMMKNSVRNVQVGNGLYPTPWRAEQYGMKEAALAKMFWNGVNVDYGALQSRGVQVKAALAAGRQLHITNPNGTDLKLQVEGRPVIVSDGIISAEDMQQGGPAVSVYLPAGEVYTTPVPGTAEGTIVDSGSYFRGKRVDRVEMHVSGGRVTSIEGSGPGYAGLRAEYDAVDDARKEEFAFVDFGINPNIALPVDSKVGNWVPAGAVTIGIGANDWAGGGNPVPYGYSVFLPGSTVTMDGKTVVEKGALEL